MNELILYIAIVILAVIFIAILVLLKKLNNKVKDANLKIDFFDQKLDSINKDLLAIMNQHYTDIITSVKKLEEKISEAERLNETMMTDKLYDEAEEIVKETEYCSASLLQRRLSVGYAMATRLVDMLEEKGIVGPQIGSNSREVIIEDEE